MTKIILCAKCKKNQARGNKKGNYCQDCAIEMMEKKVKETERLIKEPYEKLGLKVKIEGEEELNKKFRRDKQNKLNLKDKSPLGHE